MSRGVGRCKSGTRGRHSMVAIEMMALPPYLGDDELHDLPLLDVELLGEEGEGHAAVGRDHRLQDLPGCHQSQEEF